MVCGHLSRSVVAPLGQASGIGGTVDSRDGVNLSEEACERKTPQCGSKTMPWVPRLWHGMTVSAWLDCCGEPFCGDSLADSDGDECFCGDRSQFTVGRYTIVAVETAH